jgi:hypothetical protein
MPDALKWEIALSDRPGGQMVYELRAQCGLEIEFLSAEEVRRPASPLAEHGAVVRAKGLRSWKSGRPACG